MKLIKELWLAVTLILAASALLLLSDMKQRQTGRKSGNTSYRSVAIMQISSSVLLDNHVAGILDRLSESGHLAADRRNLRHFNPQGDIAMANIMAREIANGPYELVITSSTVALQVFSKANQNTSRLHVFGGVTDPYGAGVGITGTRPDEHPAYMAGIGTFQPVKGTFRILKELNPGIRKVGVVWNPGEQCSEACLKEAREICTELGIELVEAIATNTSEVSEAARSLFSKGVEAVWIGGDSVAAASAGLIINLARQAGIPVFTNDPEDIKTGALFGLGANYYTVGRLTADLAVRILDGESPSEIGIENVVPERLGFNSEVLANLGRPWALSDPISKRLARQAEEESQTNDENFITFKKSGSVPLKLRIVQYSETEFAERCYEGLMEGLKRAGMAAGRDFDMKLYNAQGDMSTLSGIMSSVKSDMVDLLMVISTPALQASLRQAGDHTRIVFTGVGDGVRAGAGKSESDHLPHVTGITTRSPFEGMARLIRETIPSARRVGTLFTPAEVNSVLYKDLFAEALSAEGLELVAVPVTSSAEVSQGAAELCRKDIQLLCQVVDNLTRPGFALISRRAADLNIPVYIFDSDQMKDGAAIGLSRDYFDAGLEAAQLAVRVLNGENPAGIPFRNTQSEKLMYNTELAGKYALRLSPQFLEKAVVFNQP